MNAAPKSRQPNSRAVADLMTALDRMIAAARDAEKVTVILGRYGAVGQGDLATFAAPFVAADGAALHTGVLAIRRSPGLDLRTADWILCRKSAGAL